MDNLPLFISLIGYLLSGVAVNFVPGLPPIDQQVTQQLARVGVILLMTDAVLHFSVRNLWAVRSTALPGAVLQMLTVTILGILFAWGFWSRSLDPSTTF